jgi:hypothetical protein
MAASSSLEAPGGKTIVVLAQPWKLKGLGLSSPHLLVPSSLAEEPGAEGRETGSPAQENRDLMDSGGDT